jgi:hypothetical protein
VNILDQAETVGPVRTLILDNVHALLNEMQPEPAGLYFFQSAHAHLVRFYSWTAIAEQDFQTTCCILISSSLNSPEEQFNGPVWPSGIGMPNDICKRFVDGSRHRPAFLGGKPEGFRQALHSPAHGAEQAGIARQLDPQEYTFVEFAVAFLHMPSPRWMKGFHAQFLSSPGRPVANLGASLQERRALREARDKWAVSPIASDKPEEPGQRTFMQNAAQAAMENGCKQEVLRPGPSFA